MQWRMAADEAAAGPASADHSQQCCWEQLCLLAISRCQCSVFSLSVQLTSNTALRTRPYCGCSVPGSLEDNSFAAHL